MTSRAFSLCSTACKAMGRTRRHKKRLVAQQLLAQITVDAGSCRLQGVKSGSCTVRRIVRFVKIGPLELVFRTSPAPKAGFFSHFLVEEHSGACDVRHSTGIN